MNFTKAYTHFFEKYFPSTFGLAVWLTLIVFSIAFIFSSHQPADVVLFWYQGLWNESLLAFAFQMILMLVLGHTIALSPVMESIMNRILAPINTSNKAVFITAFTSVFLGLINWGLGLIFGAILARKIGEKFSSSKTPLNYPLVAAASYVSMMVWHGGISGSATSKAAESGHIMSLSPDSVHLPLFISYEQTVFSSMNIFTSILLLIVAPSFLWIISKKMTSKEISIKFDSINSEVNIPDNTKFWTKNRFLGFSLLSVAIFIAINGIGWSAINTNFINFCLFSIGVLSFSKIDHFFTSLEEALKGASGIVIQFPLYFGIMGILNHTGLTQDLTQFLVSHFSQNLAPIFTFLSAGLVNIFVPSGGGQWAIQGKIVIESALTLEIPLNKMIMAFCYGDQITNMLQPFWALPLLAITKLKASEIFPYTIILFVIGLVIFLTALMVF